MSHLLHPPSTVLADLLDSELIPHAVRAEVLSSAVSLQARSGRVQDVLDWAREFQSDVVLVVQQSVVRLSTATTINEVHVEVWTHLPLVLALRIFARTGSTPEIGEPLRLATNEMDELTALAEAVA